MKKMKMIWHKARFSVSIIIMLGLTITLWVANNTAFFEDDPVPGESWVMIEKPKFEGDETFVTRILIDSISLDGKEVRYVFTTVNNIEFDTVTLSDLYESSVSRIKRIYDKEHEHDSDKKAN